MNPLPNAQCRASVTNPPHERLAVVAACDTLESLAPRFLKNCGVASACVIVASVGAAGCGSTSGAVRTAGTTGTFPSSPRLKEAGRSKQDASADPVLRPGRPNYRALQRLFAKTHGGRRGVITILPNGAIEVSSRPPRRSSREASSSCINQQREVDGAVHVVQEPPAPGLHAHRTGRVISVTYSTGHPPPSCQPVRIRVSVDAGNDSFPPITRDRTLSAVGTGSVKIVVPRFYPTMPSTAQAIAGTEDGRLSPTSAVRIGTG